MQITTRGTKKSVYSTSRDRQRMYRTRTGARHSAGQTVALVANCPNCNLLMHIQLQPTVDTHYGHMFKR